MQPAGQAHSRRDRTKRTGASGNFGLRRNPQISIFLPAFAARSRTQSRFDTWRNKRGLVLSSAHFMGPPSAGIIGTSAFISSRFQKFEEDYRKYAYNASARHLVRLHPNTEEPSVLFGTAVQGNLTEKVREQCEN